MARRIEIELTSHSAEGNWTWRAAGARQPKGVLAADLVPAGASVGGVYRAEIETGIEGIDVLSVAPKPTKHADGSANRIEVVGAPRDAPDVSVTLAPGSRRRRDGEDRPRRRDGEDRPPRRDSGARREGAGRRPGGRAAPDGPSPRREEGESRRRDARESPGRRERRPTVSSTHRNAMLAALPPEQLPVAEQLLRGGIPAVRQAIEEQRGRGRGDSGPANADPLLAMAEKLLPAVNLANWKDRATSAQSAGKELRLRELRAVVASSRTVGLDEEGRTMAKALRDALDHRVTALRDDWVARMTTALDEGRILDAIRTAARPPEPSTRLPAELAVRISADAGAALTAELAPEEWLGLLEAVVESPVRRTVKPAGIPATAEVHAAARHSAGSVPELAKLLGLRIPPPPPRRAPAPLTRAGGGGRAVSP
jgi:hypothetical protein